MRCLLSLFTLLYFALCFQPVSANEINEFKSAYQKDLPAEIFEALLEHTDIDFTQGQITIIREDGDVISLNGEGGIGVELQLRKLHLHPIENRSQAS